jgi:hypothetical protein
MRLRAVSLLTLFGCVASSTHAGEQLTLSQKVFDSDVILEVRLPLDQPIPEKWPTKKYDPKSRGFPEALIKKAQQSATVERVLRSGSSEPAPTVPENLYVFSSSSPCWWKAHERGAVRTLVFLKRFTDKTRAIAGVEHETGLYTDLNPNYEDLVTAIQQAGAWPEERMRAVGAEMLWPAEREVLKSSKSPYLLNLAVEFLRTHDASNVIDEIWGASGSEPRMKREAESKLTYENVCKP